MNYIDILNKIYKTVLAIIFLVWNWMLVVVSTYGAYTAMNNQQIDSEQYYIFYYLLYAISYYGLGLLLYIIYYILKIWGTIEFINNTIRRIKNAFRK